MNKIISPITGSYNTSIVQTFKVDKLIESYKTHLNINVASYFVNIDEVYKCRCQDTDFYFIYPRNLSADGIFYDQLQKFSWYYQDWKWEFSVIEELITVKDRVLEIGCGKGAFLKKLKSNGNVVVGLELSNDAVEWGKKNNISIINEYIEEFSIKNESSFSVVCSFQVLEHISDIKSFMESSLHALEKGGKLIFAVPDNNNLFFKYQNLYSKVQTYIGSLLLNLPPHHMNFWTKNSLTNLQSYYPIKVDNFFYEPDHYNRTEATREIWLEKICNNFLFNNKFSKKLLRKFLSLLKFKGDSIIVVYHKI